MKNKSQTRDEHKKPHLGHWLLTFLFFTMAVFVVGKNTMDFHASVIPTRQAAPFDGTTLPVLKVPKWTSLGTDLYKAAYDSIPADKMVSLPVYNPDTLKTPADSLGWKSESDLAIRNAKITYSVVYMGNYKLDNIENAGSHLAVDIKMPDNTPVYAIANGVVDKVAEQTTGFGNHIVIKHENVPSLTNSSARTTIYSTYNHLSQVLVAEGDVVTKGQLIGKSGHSGTATTPHLHFQIDNDQAPWHPYWPYTYQEADAAGVDFWDAVNIGLGANKARQTTINPMLYVQKYLNGSPAQGNNDTPAPAQQTPSTPAPDQASPASTDTTPAVSDDATPPSVSDTPVIPDNAVTEPVVRAAAFAMENDTSFVANAPKTLKIKAVDASGNIVKSYKPSDAVYLEILAGGAKLPQSVKSSEFSGGAADVTITPTADATLQIKATDGTISGETRMMTASLFSDVAESSSYFQAVNFLKDHGVIDGYPDGTFKPSSVVSRVEVLKFILKGANARLISVAKLPFKDTKTGQWYSDFVATGFSKDIVKGYNDSTFKPENTVSRAEFIKMLVVAMELKIDTYVTRDPFKDVSKDAWYALYVKFAKDKNIIDARGEYFRPDEGMTREEVADALYRAIILKVSGADKYSDSLAVASDKLVQYFG
jgi:murein DD-endopeptidase MepM/ murein hydrolase activator NlpD